MRNRVVKIGDKLVGEDYSPFIICEISANHNGKIDKALELISLKVSLLDNEGLW